MTDPTDNVVPFPGMRRDAIVADESKALFSLAPDPRTDVLVPSPDPLPVSSKSSGKPRAKSATKRPTTKPRYVRQPPEPQTPEGIRALEIARDYKAKQPVCDERKVADAIETAIGHWPDDEIVAAVDRLVDSVYGVTTNSLLFQLRTGKPQAREVDPVIHQAIDTALERLGRLDSETMTETEQALAAALRQVCVAVMHGARGAA